LNESFYETMITIREPQKKNMLISQTTG